MEGGSGGPARAQLGATTEAPPTAPTADGTPPGLNDLMAPPADKPAAEPAAAPAKKRKRTVRIKERDPVTNRATAYDIEDED
jgi:hypothetical protein